MMHPLPQCDILTVKRIKDHKQQIEAGILKEPSDIWGIVNNPIWDFVEPAQMVFPELHIEVGLVNNVLDNFYSFIDNQVEAPTAEEKCSRNTYIVADVALIRVLESLAQWKDADDIALQSHWYEATQIRELLRNCGLSAGEENQHRHQLMLLEQHIHALIDERKN
jgi:hypothetical protein